MIKKSIDPLIKKEILKELSKKNNLMIISKIGHGGYSTVYTIKYLNKGIFAMKLIIFEKKNNNYNYVKKNDIIKKENLHSTLFKHENIIKTICLYENEIILSLKEKIKKNNNYNITKVIKEFKVHSIIMEKAIYNNLANFINYFYNCNLLRNYSNLKIKWLKKLSLILIKDFILQILYGLYYLKKCKYVHRDLKPENIVICKNFILKIIDFNQLGLCLDKKDEKIELINSTLSIMGPEYFKKEKSIYLKEAEKIDIFSIGIILYNCLYGEELYDSSYKNNNNKTIELNEQYIEKGIKKLNENKNEFNKFIIKCLNKNIEKRPTINECIQQKNLNINKKDNKRIRYNNYNEETKLFIEFQKYNFINKKRKLKKLKTNI